MLSEDVKKTVEEDSDDEEPEEKPKKKKTPLKKKTPKKAEKEEVGTLLFLLPVFSLILAFSLNLIFLAR
jgi:hypothetical protein